jgi:hypothetical protein
MPLRRSAQNINYGIEQTAKTMPRRFWAFNNGVTALVHDIKDDPNTPRLQLDGIAVVNGAQTTGSLGRVDAASLNDVRVLIRFVKAANPDLIQDIIRYNNSQNQIKPSDFRSGDRHQERLRAEFKGIPDSLYLGARRGGPEDRARKPSNLISSDTAAQALAAFHQEPGIAYHDLRSIWENNDVYARFFSDHTTAEHIVFCYSLWQCVADAKSHLTAMPSDQQTEDTRDALQFLRRRGSLYLFVAAIGVSAEIYLSRVLTDTFKLSFGRKVSPVEGSRLWAPLVEALLPLAPGQLSSVFDDGGLRRKDVVDAALKSYRAVVASTRKGNAVVFEEFRKHVIGDFKA